MSGDRRPTAGPTEGARLWLAAGAAKKEGVPRRADLQPRAPASRVRGGSPKAVCSSPFPQVCVAPRPDVGVTSADRPGHVGAQAALAT